MMKRPDTSRNGFADPSVATGIGDTPRREILKRLLGVFAPQSLKARTTVLLLSGMAFVQCLSFSVYALDRFWLTDRAIMQESKHRALTLYQAIISLPIEDRNRAVAGLRLPQSFSVKLASGPDLTYSTTLPNTSLTLLSSQIDQGSLQLRSEDPSSVNQQRNRDDKPDTTPKVFFIPEGRAPLAADESSKLAGLMILSSNKRPRAIIFDRRPRSHLFSMSMLLSDENRWLVVHFHVPPPNPFGSWSFFAALLTMAVGGGVVIALGTQRLMTPISTLSAAAEQLGNNPFAPPLPEKGATEIRRATHAFNQMAERIRRFLRDRTLILTALSHDLRTPLTRMKLRTEFIDDPELRERFSYDLAEMETMVATTLALGSDPARQEAFLPVDLSQLLAETVSDIIAARPQDADNITFETDESSITIRGQGLLLKRALSNVILNALTYGARADVELHLENVQSGQPHAVVIVDDCGPGLPDDQLEQMLEPFARAEKSRNRQTGGHGLGLAIARSAVQAHHGRITLSNRAEGGLRATISMPCQPPRS